MTPESIGLARSPDDAGIVMGKHSGRNALNTRLKQLGFDLSSGEVDDVFRRFKALADKKKVRACSCVCVCVCVCVCACV